MSDNVREMWSDDELDGALAALNSTVDTDEQKLAAARTELMATAGMPVTASVAAPVHKRHWGRWAIAAAAVLALIAGFLVVQTVQVGDKPPAASAAAASLNSAADRIHASDPALRPGQFRYIGTHAWWSAGTEMHGKDFLYLGENLLETWVPADQSGEWLLRRNVTGARKWILGTETEAEAAGWRLNEGGWPEGEWRAPCGDFYAKEEGKQPSCDMPGGWQTPNERWLASLPRDPQALYDRLRKDAPENGRGDAELLVYVADALRSGLIPAELRAAMYRALGKLPGLEITDKQANLDGRVGIAYGMNDGTLRQEMIIDPATGEFIGERETFTKDERGLPAGTVMEYTSMTTAVVDARGVRPPG
jgi:hypothetical protein